jgi:chemotaxis protein histidine kinase CheA
VSSFEQELMQEFSVELIEHVEACERVLVRAASDGVSEDDVNLLFRSMHSIKGLARVLSASGLEKLAHVAESLLSSVREGTTELDTRAQELLLQAVDAVKQARASLLEGVEFRADEALLVGLEAASTRQKSADAAGSADIVHEAAAGDLYFDRETLVGLAEMFEEMLPALAETVATGDAGPSALEDIEVLTFAARKVGLVALAGAVAKLADRRDPPGYARCLHLVDRFSQLLERECGVAAASRAARRWLSPALTSAIEAGRWSDADLLLRALLPQSPFVGLVSQLISAEVSDDVRRAARGLLLETLPLELSSATPAGADLSALAAERLRNMLLGPHQIPAAAMKIIDAQRLDLDRFRTLPIALVARLQALAQDAVLFEVVLEQPQAKAALVDLARRVCRELNPILTEGIVEDRVRCLVCLLTTAETEDQLRARVTELVGQIGARAIRKLERHQGATHFGVKARVAAEPAATGIQVRVPVALLDSMFGRVGQFFSVTTRFNALVFDSEVQDILSELVDYCVLQAPHLLPKVERLVRQQNDYAAIEAEVHRLISMIHEMTLGLRVIPIDTLLSRLPRMARDLAQRQGKIVRFDSRSNGIRVDNGMLELLADPLVHMVRNCVDHGIETADAREKVGKPRTATVFVRAEQRGNHILIEVGDDGRGIDIERVLAKAIAKDLVDAAQATALTEEQIARFIFSPGFSTADRVSDTSGRGVGMDVALVNVTKLGGVIDIVTRSGQGTTFRIGIPLSKAIQSMLIAETGVQTVAFPDRMVVECTVAPASDVQMVNGQRAILLRGRFLPLFSLVELLRLPAPAPSDGDLSIVVCELDGRRAGIEVRRIRRRTDLLIQEVHPRIAKLPGIGGISTLGTDKIVVVVDPEGLFDLARRHAVFGLRTHETRVAEGTF